MSQISITTSATSIVTANTARISLIIENEGDEIVYIGPDSSTTSGSGVALIQGGTYTEDSGGMRMFMGDVWGITTTSTSDIRYWERTR